MEQIKTNKQMRAFIKHAMEVSEEEYKKGCATKAALERVENALSKVLTDEEDKSSWVAIVGNARRVAHNISTNYITMVGICKRWLSLQVGEQETIKIFASNIPQECQSLYEDFFRMMDISFTFEKEVYTLLLVGLGVDDDVYNTKRVFN